MTFPAFTKPLAAFAIFSLLLWFSALPAVGDPPLPRALEDVTKLDKPTISYDARAVDDPYIEEIRLVDLDGENDRLWMRGTREVGLSGAPQWSLDGKRAAVVAIDSIKGVYAPYILDLERGKEKSLYDLLPRDLTFIHLNWSPDGRWLAMAGKARIGHDSDIYKLGVDTGKLVRLTHKMSAANWSPNWSPDGKKIAFDAKTEGLYRDIYTIDAADGKNRVKLTNLPLSSWPAVWSPDGKWIAFHSYLPEAPVSGTPDYAEMYVMRPDGSNVQRLTFNDTGDFAKCWSPDSKWIVYSHYSRQADGGRLGGLYRMHIETKEIRLIKQGISAINATWVLAGKSRFLSVDPAGEKKTQWGKIKAAGGSPNNPTSQDSGE